MIVPRKTSLQDKPQIEVVVTEAPAKYLVAIAVPGKRLQHVWVNAIIDAYAIAAEHNVSLQKKPWK